MKHLQKFNEYYVIDPNFEAFHNQVFTIATKKYNSDKTISTKDMKNHIIEAFGGMQEFKYGDDFKEKLAIIDKIVALILK